MVDKLKLFLLFFLLLLERSKGQHLLEIGVQYPLTGTPYGQTWADIAQIATTSFNSKDLIPGYSMALVITDTHSQRAGVVGTSITCALDVGLDDDVTVDSCLGALGGETSEMSQLSQYVFQNFNVPQISSSATATVLSDKSQYPTFFRSIPSDAAAGNAFARAIVHFGWQQVAILIGSDAYSISLHRSFTLAALNYNITIKVETFMDANEPDYPIHVTRLKEAYIQVFIIFASAADVQNILREGYTQGILGPSFVWLGADTFHSLEVSKLPPVAAMQGTLVIAASTSAKTPLAEEFHSLIQRANVSDYYAGFIFDAVYAFGHAFKIMVENNRNLTRKELMKGLQEVFFEGVTGQFYFDSNGDRNKSYYGVSSFLKNGSVVGVGELTDSGYLPTRSIIWSDGSENIPLDVLHIIKHPPPRPVKTTFEVLAGVMLAILCLLLLTFGFVIITKQPLVQVKLGQVLVHVLNTVGGVLGYSAVLVIVSGVDHARCTAAVVLLDLSLLICGGVLSLRTVMKFAEEYRDHTIKKTGLVRPRTASFFLFFFWGLTVILNIAVLVGTLSHSPPETRLHLLEKNTYEYQCHFSKAAIIILPLTIGLLFIFSLVTTLLKIFVNRAVATKKHDILNSVNNIITLFAFVVATVTLILIDPTQTQIDITACLVILLANFSAPTAILGWFSSPKRKDIIFRGLVEKESPLSPRQQLHRHSLISDSLSPPFPSSLPPSSSSPPTPSPLSSPSPSPSPPTSSFVKTPSSTSLSLSSSVYPPISPRSLHLPSHSQHSSHRSLSAAELNSI